MLKEKQMQAIQLLTCGKGYSFKEICEILEISEMTLYRWRNEAEFKAKLEEINAARWQAAEDVAREGIIGLCRDGNFKAIEFVLKNCGFNPAVKVDADLDASASIDVNIY